jgi:hypothetical protein
MAAATVRDDTRPGVLGVGAAGEEKSALLVEEVTGEGQM